LSTLITFWRAIKLGAFEQSHQFKQGMGDVDSESNSMIVQPRGLPNHCFFGFFSTNQMLR
jgi:hypothetical protein